VSNKRRRSSGNRSASSGSRGGSKSSRPSGSGSRRVQDGRSSSTTKRPKAGSGAGRGNSAPRGRGAGRRPPRERIFPPDGAPSAGASAWIGLRTTISSVPLVGLCLLGPLVLWSVLALLNAPPTPQAMNEALGLAPVRSTLEVVSLLFGAQITGGQLASLGAFGFQILFYASFMTLAISLARSAQDGEPAAVALATAWIVLRARVLWMIVVELGFVSIALLLVFLPLLLGGFAYPVGLMAVIYFTVYVPPAVVLNGMTGREALRAAFEGARMVRTNHVFLVGCYVLLVVVAFIGPGVPGVVTPTIGVWVYALVVGLLHVSMLSIFVHRWRVLSPAFLSPAPGADAGTVPAAEA
jgi:hypothetical protein